MGERRCTWISDMYECTKMLGQLEETEREDGDEKGCCWKQERGKRAEMFVLVLFCLFCLFEFVMNERDLVKQRERS